MSTISEQVHKSQSAFRNIQEGKVDLTAGLATAVSFLLQGPTPPTRMDHKDGLSLELAFLVYRMHLGNFETVYGDSGSVLKLDWVLLKISLSHL